MRESGVEETKNGSDLETEHTCGETEQSFVLTFRSVWKHSVLLGSGDDPRTGLFACSKEQLDFEIRSVREVQGLQSYQDHSAESCHAPT